MDEKKFGTIITNKGAALIADCILRGEVLPITTAAAGDGGGAYYEPSADQTALRNECWRGEIAGFSLSEYAQNMLDIKIIIDDEVGGFTIREMGLFADDGTMVAICNTPDTEKISITGGIPGRLTMLMHIIVSDASAVKIVINPELDTITSEQFARDIAKHISGAVEVSSNATPAVGVKTHYFVLKSVSNYVTPYEPPDLANVEDGILNTSAGTVAGYVAEDTDIHPMAILTE